MPQLECQDIVLGYEGNVVITDLSFSASEGDYLCILGENGSGKSTLMKTILMLNTPVSGQIILGDGLKANEIGYLPQQNIVQKDFPASVREVVRSGCLNRCGWRPFYNKTEKQMAEDNMDRLGISSLAKRCYRELSGGQQQRVLLARALCATQKILLLDEPAAGLDPSASLSMYSLISSLNSEGITVIMISHDIAAALEYASHILHLGGGSCLFFGSKEDYLKNRSGSMFAKPEVDKWLK
ncbi:MAG: metal ABC transporter ATP-binding protein [Eubacteriaceae bacterium]|nr:metal ABC transporter ATP-binding protein [Eubacteriaceae bacterium]